MTGSALGQLPIFLAVAEKRSFTTAAAALGLSPSAVSQAVSRLERELGVALFVRTTRSVNLTDAGARLAAECRPALSAVSATLAALVEKRDEPSGTLRLNVPRIACHTTLPSILATLATEHPEMRVDVVVDDRNIDIVREGFDAGIRHREEVHKDMVAVRISPAYRFAVVGSKRYFATHDKPRHPKDLVRHTCLPWRYPTTGGLWRWEFEHRGRPIDVAVEGRITSTDPTVLVACARHGLGLAYVPEIEVHADIAAGRLQTALESYCLEVPGLFLYFPRAARKMPRLAAFIECAKRVS
jgi:DNA-binding transcriptional LysR family regulator